jgi:hypothetical protein
MLKAARHHLHSQDIYEDDVKKESTATLALYRSVQYNCLRMLYGFEQVFFTSAKACRDAVENKRIGGLMCIRFPVMQ